MKIKLSVVKKKKAQLFILLDVVAINYLFSMEAFLLILS